MTLEPSSSSAWHERWITGCSEIGFLLLPGFSMLELFCAVDPLRVANRIGPHAAHHLSPQDFGWMLLSLDGEPVKASNDIEIGVDGKLGAGPAPGILFIMASYEPEARVTARHVTLLRHLAARGVLLGAVDTGAFILARAKLLAGRRITLHWEAASAFAEEFSDIEVTSGLYEFDRDRLTCSGGSAVIDMMLFLITLRGGDGFATAVAEQILHPPMRSGANAQRMSPALRYAPWHHKVAAAVELMEQHMEQPLSMHEIATRIGVSQRQLERLSRAGLGQTAKNFYVGLRLERARQLLIASRITVTQAAIGTGFESVAHFSRAFRASFGYSPGATRKMGADSAPRMMRAPQGKQTPA